jgi:hypothetical protein
LAAARVRETGSAGLFGDGPDPGVETDG